MEFLSIEDIIRSRLTAQSQGSSPRSIPAGLQYPEDVEASPEPIPSDHEAPRARHAPDEPGPRRRGRRGRGGRGREGGRDGDSREAAHAPARAPAPAAATAGAGDGDAEIDGADSSVIHVDPTRLERGEGR